MQEEGRQAGSDHPLQPLSQKLHPVAPPPLGLIFLFIAEQVARPCRAVAEKGRLLAELQAIQTPVVEKYYIVLYMVLFCLFLNPRYNAQPPNSCSNFWASARFPLCLHLSDPTPGAALCIPSRSVLAWCWPLRLTAIRRHSRAHHNLSS